MVKYNYTSIFLQMRSGFVSREHFLNSPRTILLKYSLSVYVRELPRLRMARYKLITSERTILDMSLSFFRFAAGRRRPFCAAHSRTSVSACAVSVPN